MSEIAPALGLAAGAVGVADTIPYIRDTLRGRTRPHRGTWFIWGNLAVVVSVSQWADGASWSLTLSATQIVLIGFIFVLSIGRGEGGVSAPELFMIAVAGAGVAGWVTVDEAVVATAFVVAADLIGTALMMPKTYRDPESETLSTFVLASVAGALAAASVGAVQPALLLYPLYFCVVNGALALLIAGRRAELVTA